MFRARHTLTFKNQRRLIVNSLFRTDTKILLAFISRAAWQHRYYITKVGHWRRGVLEGHAPFQVPYTIIFFSAKGICTINLTVSFYLYLYLKPCEKCFFFRRSVTSSWQIFRDEKDLVVCFLGCVVKFPAREANSWRRKAGSNPGNWVCIFFPFFLFLPF